MINLNREAAIAAVVCCHHFGVNPLAYHMTKGKHRYYIFRVLLMYFRSKYVQVSAPTQRIALYAGYTGMSAKVVGTPSQEKNYQLDRGLLDELYAKFLDLLDEKIQNRARSSSALIPSVPVTSGDDSPQVVARQPIIKSIRDVSPPVMTIKPVGRDIPSFLPSRGKAGSRDMYRMLQEAVLNTGGKLVK